METLGSWGSPIAALIISVATFMYGVYASKRKATLEDVITVRSQLREELRVLKDRVTECERARAVLTYENVELMRRLVRLENGG